MYVSLCVILICIVSVPFRIGGTFYPKSSKRTIVIHVCVCIPQSSEVPKFKLCIFSTIAFLGRNLAQLSPFLVIFPPEYYCKNPC